MTWLLVQKVDFQTLLDTVIAMLNAMFVLKEVRWFQQLISDKHHNKIFKAI